MFKTLPKTASTGEVQRNYRVLFDEVMDTEEPLFVLNNNKPEVVIISVKKFELLSQSQEEYEQNMAQEAIKNYRAEKKAGKLKKLSSLSDLV